MGTLATRIGGAFGILAAVVMIPAFLVGSPDQLHTPDQVRHYYESGSAFVTANGEVPLLHILFGIVFVGALTSMLIRAVGPRAEIYIALSGGVIWLALTAAGQAAEVAYPAAMVRFGDATSRVQPTDADVVAWLYHYSQLGAAAMILSRRSRSGARVCCPNGRVPWGSSAFRRCCTRGLAFRRPSARWCGSGWSGS